MGLSASGMQPARNSAKVRFLDLPRRGHRERARMPGANAVKNCARLPLDGQQHTAVLTVQSATQTLKCAGKVQATGCMKNFR